MRIQTILDQIDMGAMALPEFQRGYVWGRPQVRGLMHSLYHRHPVGSLLLWETRAEDAVHRGHGTIQPGYVALLLDGQQRITSLYGIMRGEAPPFFEGNPRSFTELYFNIDEETFEFYAPVKMGSDPSWLNVTAVFADGPGPLIAGLTDRIEGDADRLGEYMARLQRLYAIGEVDLQYEQVTGEDKTLDVVVDIFNRVNSGGTKLSKGDLALAKICARWPEGRQAMHQQLSAWEEAGFHFSLDWLLRNVNAVVTGRAEFSALANEPVEAIQDGLARASRAVDMSLNLIGSRLGLDHNRVLGARAALPLISRYLSDRRFSLRDSAEADGLLYWYVNAFLWGRYAGSTETVLNQDLEAIRESSEDPVRALIGALEASRGDLRIRPNDFVGWSRGARFYPLLYLLTRVQHARDWGSGIELRQSLLGARASLELHHVFPKAQLYRHGYSRQEVNALANFTFLTMETNREISDRDPAEYLPEFASRHPGAVDSHWVPMDRELWSVERYLDFLEARRELLARAANEFLDELRGGLGDPIDLEDGRPVAASVESEELGDEEREIRDARRWVIERGLAAGEIDFELVDEKTGELRATLDLAWPDGVQPGLTQPLALLLDEGAEVEEVAGRHGFRFFTSSDSLKSFILDEVLEEGQAA